MSEYGLGGATRSQASSYGQFDVSRERRLDIEDSLNRITHHGRVLPGDESAANAAAYIDGDMMGRGHAMDNAGRRTGFRQEKRGRCVRGFHPPMNAAAAYSGPNGSMESFMMSRETA